MYRCYPKRKKSGGVRQIEEPFPILKNAQRKLCHLFLNGIPIHDCLHGHKGTSQISAAKNHVRQPIVIAMDIQNFFPSVRKGMINRALLSNGMNAAMSDRVCRLTTRKNRLPQGAPTSPVLARIVISPVLIRIENMLSNISLNCRFAMFVDDLSLSGPEGLRRAIPLIVRIFKQNGFNFRPEKTKVMKGSDEKEVLGIRVNERLEPGAEFRLKLDLARRDRKTSPDRRRALEAWRRKLITSGVSVSK